MSCAFAVLKKIEFALLPAKGPFRMCQFAFTVCTKMWKMCIHVSSTIVSLQKLKTTQSLLSKIAKFTSVPMGNAPTSRNGRLWFCMNPLHFPRLIPVHINVVAKNCLAQHASTFQHSKILQSQTTFNSGQSIKPMPLLELTCKIRPVLRTWQLWTSDSIWWDWWDWWAHPNVPARNCAIHSDYCITRILSNQR